MGAEAVLVDQGPGPLYGSITVYGLLLGGSWVVITGVISRVIRLITPIRGLIAPLITTLLEPPSRG